MVDYCNITNRKITTTRKMVFFLFSFSLFFISLTAFADSSNGIGATSGTCGTNLTWTMTNGTLTISGTGAMKNYTGSSGAPWEAVKSSITSIVINSGATSIGDLAFYGCSNLKSVNLPTTITTIGNSAFNGCSKLPNITLKDKVRSLGKSAFANCSALKTFSFPSSLTSIGESCFNSSGLRSITIPSTVTEMGDFVFSYCYSLTKITFSDGLTVIPKYVLEGCSNLDEILIGEGTEEIEYGAFSYCQNLTTITIPATLSSVDSFAFDDCLSLSDVHYAGTKTQANKISIGTGNTCFTGATWHFYEVENILRLPSSLTRIESEAFAYVNAQKIVIPSSVKRIDSKAFANCSKLVYLEMPSGSITIADDILSGCGDVIIICSSGSQAEQWAKRNQLEIQYR